MNEDSTFEDTAMLKNWPLRILRDATICHVHAVKRFWRSRASIIIELNIILDIRNRIGRQR
jgi:hypothetical protein